MTHLPSERALRNRLPKLFVAALVTLLSSALFAQAAPDKTETIVRKDTALVTVDLLATDKQGHPIENLRPDEIKVYENGKEQKVQHFEHVSRNAARPATIHREGWINNVDSEAQRPSSKESIILLLDALNVGAHDEARARKLMLETLQKFPPDQQVAVFLLGNKLKQLTGFTDDPKILRKVVESVNLRHASTLDSANLVTELGIRNELADKDPSGYLVVVAAMLRNLQSFELETIASTIDLRMKLTIDAINQIAAVSSGVQGRKNLVWISEAFPLNLSPTAVADRSVEFNASRDYHDDIKKITARLTAARVAVYPVKIEGLTAYDKAENALPAFNPSTTSRPDDVSRQYSSIFDSNGSGTLVQHQSSIDTIKMMAEESGGRAYFNTNNFTGAITGAMADGSDYYALDYVPPKMKYDQSSVRTIKIKSSRPDIQLRYRRSYIPNPPSEGPTNELEQALNPTIPLRDGLEIAAKAEPCNGKLLSVAVAPKDLQLETMGDGRREAKLSVGYVAIATGVKDATPLRSMRDLEIPLDAKSMIEAERSGIPITFRLEIPEGKYRTRVGIYDRNSMRSGSVDVDFSSKPCTLAAEGSPRKPEASEAVPDLLPEEGTLTSSAYVNSYYGLRLELPRAMTKKRQRIGVMPRGIHALLAIEFQDHMKKGGLVAYAINASSGEPVDAMIAANEEARTATKQGISVEGPMERNGKEGRYWLLLEKGPDLGRNTLVYFVPRHDALLKIAGTSDDEALFKSIAISLGRFGFTEHMASTPTNNVYFGPAVPDQWVEEAISAKPGSQFKDKGEFVTGRYRNGTLKLDFTIADQWEMLSLTEGSSEFDQIHQADPTDQASKRELQFFRACSLPLFYLREKKQENEAQTLSLFVVDQNCLRISFPSAGELPALDDFASWLSMFHDFGSPKKAGMVRVDGRPFVILRGELSYPGPDANLQTRRWQNAYVTGVEDKLLVWFWTYPRSGTKGDWLLPSIRLR